jgi:phosphoribosylformylglycinamidine synthase
VILLGEGAGELGGSEYLKLVYDQVRGVPPALDLSRERALQDLVVTLAQERLIRSAHDCSDGGLAVTLAECCFGTAGIGVEASIDSTSIASEVVLNDAASLFGESASRIVVSTGVEDVTMVLERASALQVPARVIGRTGSNRLRIAVAGRIVIDLPVEEAERLWSSAIDSYFQKKIA